MSNGKFRAFGLKEIAGWALNNYWQKNQQYAALPPIQRGFVWKAEQIERLWDSIARGFPIGSLLLGPMNSTESKAFAGCDKRKEPPTWFLLDGQQRATSIIKGFQDIWSEGKTDAVSALWVDLAPPKMEETDRHFLFRLVTRSHPWGYSRTSMGRLSFSAVRDALKAFRKDANDQRKPHEFGLHEVFPWDAEAPVPLALLLQSIDDGGDLASIACRLRNKLENIALWQGNTPEKLQKATKLLDNLDQSNAGHFAKLVEGLKQALDHYRIPAPILDIEDVNKRVDNGTPTDAAGKQSDETHASFVLFERVNTGGTTLSKDEIRYSLLKSKWPEAPRIIEENLLKKRQFCDPARMVSLMARLYLMVKPEEKKRQAKGLEGELALDRFEMLLRKRQADFQQWLKETGSKIVEDAWNLLVWSKESDYGLPKVLAADITRHHQDLMLALLYWLSRIDLNGLSEEQRRRTLGFVTAVAWYAIDEVQCVRVMAGKLRESCHADSFNQEMFASLLGENERGRSGMVRLPSPEEVNEALRSPWGGGEVPVFRKDGDDCWSKRDFWDLYPMPKDGEEAAFWYQKSDNARLLLHAIFDAPKWRSLLYAQRAFIETHFEWFDPTQPDAVSERNRPWDYDHILPKAWVNYRGLPKLIRTWLWSIGNFRVWPMECNRSKRDGEMFEESLEAYELKSLESVMRASFVNPDNENWMKLANDTKTIKFWNAPGAWHQFVEAALNRTVNIYRDWHEQLRIADLSPKAG